MKRLTILIREPIVLFIFLGFLFFFLYEKTTGYVEHYNKQIYVSHEQDYLLQRKTTFLGNPQVWNRPRQE